MICAICGKTIKREKDGFWKHSSDYTYHIALPTEKRELAVYKFFFDCGRMGNIEAIFVADKRVMKFMNGKYVYFGEVLGKHSEVDCFLGTDTELTLISDKPEIVELFQEYKIEIGHNPVTYWAESIINSDDGEIIAFQSDWLEKNERTA